MINPDIEKVLRNGPQSARHVAEALGISIEEDGHISAAFDRLLTQIASMCEGRVVDMAVNRKGGDSTNLFDGQVLYYNTDEAVELERRGLISAPHEVDVFTGLAEEAAALGSDGQNLGPLGKAAFDHILSRRSRRG